MFEPGKDLADYHQPLTDLFVSPPVGDESAGLRLSDEQVTFYRNFGYVSGLRVLSEVQLDVLRGELDLLTQPDHSGSEYWYEYNSNESADPTRVLFHALGAWRIQPALHDLLWNPAVTVPASQLLGGAVRFWHDQLFCKPAHHGGVVSWHQDYSYWTRTTPMNHLTCWIGLDDSTQENGCLQFIPGSHRWDLLPITGLAGDMDAIHQVLSEEQWKAFNNPQAVELKAGECSFHHPLMVHGSYENRTSQPRRAVVINMCLDGVCSLSDDPLLAGTDVVPSGQPLDGRFYPLLYNPAMQG